jgi:3-oxoacyl-[acyl-carrier-protein] synthase-3
MRGVGIAAISTHFPDGLVRIDELSEWPELADSDRAMIARTGIQCVRASVGSSRDDLAVAAVKQLISERHVSASAVDALLLVASRAPNTFGSSEATRLQMLTGLDRALSFSISDLGCVSVSAAILAGSALLEAYPNWKTVLIAHESRPIGERRYRRPVTVNGDGAFALALTPGAPIEIIDICVETDGEYWDLFTVEFRDKNVWEWRENCKDIRQYAFTLAMESRNRFTSMIDRQLASHGLHRHDIDHYVMQNISTGAFEFYEQAFGLSFAEACRLNLSRYGHLGSMDIILNLKTGIETGEFQQGDLILALNNSPVAAWSTMLVRLRLSLDTSDAAAKSRYL